MIGLLHDREDFATPQSSETFTIMENGSGSTAGPGAGYQTHIWRRCHAETPQRAYPVSKVAPHWLRMA